MLQFHDIKAYLWSAARWSHGGGFLWGLEMCPQLLKPLTYLKPFGKMSEPLDIAELALWGERRQLPNAHFERVWEKLVGLACDLRPANEEPGGMMIKLFLDGVIGERTFCSYILTNDWLDHYERSWRPWWWMCLSSLSNKKLWQDKSWHGTDLVIQQHK